MNDTRRRWCRVLLPGRIVSPGALVVSAAVMAGVFVICHLAGWRENTSFLCGTPPAGESAGLAILLGLVYALSYFALVVLAPILVLAAAIFGVLLRLWCGISRSARATRG